MDTFAHIDDEFGVLYIIDEQLSDRLKLKGNRSPLCFNWISDVTQEELDSRNVTVKI